MKAVALGSGDLWIWKEDSAPEHRSIRVEKISPEEVRPALEHDLGSLREAEVIYAGSGVLLRGEITRIDECSRIAALLNGYPKEVHNETTLSESLLTDAKRRLETWIRKSAYTNRLRVEEIARDLWVRGSVESAIEQSKIQDQLHGIFPLALFEISSLPDSAPTVHFRVFLLELKKSRFHTLGLSWPAAQESAFRVSTAGLETFLSLDQTLEMLEGEGTARILSSPELVVRAPGEAELFAGGELPIHVQSHFFSDITWKNYGLTLKLNVTQTTGERVRLDIFTEVSHLDSSIAMDKIPGIQSNRMKTQVDARYGVPLLLSGLLQDGMRKDAKGLPLLRQIPILGALFGSEDYLNERSELVAILVPSTAPPDPPMEKIAHYSPKGLLPPPRAWMSPEQERATRESPDYPWNALK